MRAGGGTWRATRARARPACRAAARRAALGLTLAVGLPLGLAASACGAADRPAEAPREDPWSSTPLTPEWTDIARPVAGDHSRECEAVYQALPELKRLIDLG